MKMKSMDFPKEGMKSMPAKSMNGSAHELPMNTVKFSKGGSMNDPHKFSHGHAGGKGAWSPSLGGSVKG